GVWAVRSPSLADHPLRPATDRRPGRPLPHQLANRPRAPPRTLDRFNHELDPMMSAVLATLSGSYPPLEGRSPTCYSAVRHYPPPEGERPFDLHVLGTPPAFILSQDQTLHRNCRSPFSLTP